MSLTNKAAWAAWALGLAILPATALAQGYRVIDTGVSGPAHASPNVSGFPLAAPIDADRNVAASPHAPAAPSPANSPGVTVGAFKLPSLRKLVTQIVSDFEDQAALAESQPLTHAEEAAQPLAPADEIDLALTVVDFRAASYPPAASDRPPLAEAPSDRAAAGAPLPTHSVELASVSPPRQGELARGGRMPAARLSPQPHPILETAPALLPTVPVALVGLPQPQALARGATVRSAALVRPPQLAIEVASELLPTAPVTLISVPQAQNLSRPASVRGAALVRPPQVLIETAPELLPTTPVRMVTANATRPAAAPALRRPVVAAMLAPAPAPVAEA
ncbi:MAG: hypothetical protein ABW042_06600, partial [Phenylobacterium sp.]